MQFENGFRRPVRQTIRNNNSFATPQKEIRHRDSPQPFALHRISLIFLGRTLVLLQNGLLTA